MLPPVCGNIFVLTRFTGHILSINQASEIKIHRLDNGFTIAMERLPYLHSASLGVWIKTGSAAEQRSEAGLAHFLEHLFFKGTKTRNVHEIMETIEGRGGYLNAATSREYTTLYVRMLKKHISVGIEILADILINSTFTDMEKERGVILEEIASIEDTPDELAHDLLSEFHWPDHPLGRPVSGYADTVAAMINEDVQRFYKTWYKPSNMVFAIAGNFEEEEVLRQVTETFSGLPAGEAPRMDSAPTFQAGIQMVERPISQVHIGIAMPGPSAQDEKRYLCNLLAGILGGGGTSRLFEIIREQEGLAYNVYAYHTGHISAGMMGIYEAVAPNNCERALKLTFDELRRIYQEPIALEELDRSREQLKGSMLMALESTHARVSRMAKGLLFKGRIIPIEEIIEHIDAVTVPSIQEFAQEFFRPDSCALLLLGPSGTWTPEKIDL